MSDDNVIKQEFGGEAIEWIVGPYVEEYRVVLDGREIPKLTANRRTDGSVALILDDRFLSEFPDDETAYQAAILTAHALAIGAGYSSYSADSRDQPFAPVCCELPPPQGKAPPS